MDKSKIAEYYDEYTVRQKKVGLNSRHRTILKKLKQSGLFNNAKVLEIGCGIGTVSGLVASYLSNGTMVSVDISAKSIEIAKATHIDKKNIEFVVSDMSTFNYKHKFDFVLLPDVIEHIPIEQHLNLFKVIRENIHDDATICINVPNPYMLDWMRKNKPESMQYIDQSIYSDILVSNVYPNGFFIQTLESYSLTSIESDYQWIVLRVAKPLEKINFKSNVDKAILNTKLRLKI